MTASPSVVHFPLNTHIHCTVLLAIVITVENLSFRRPTVLGLSKIAEKRDVDY